MCGSPLHLSTSFFFVFRLPLLLNSLLSLSCFSHQFLLVFLFSSITYFSFITHIIISVVFSLLLFKPPFFCSSPLFALLILSIYSFSCGQLINSALSSFLLLSFVLQSRPPQRLFLQLYQNILCTLLFIPNSSFLSRYTPFLFNTDVQYLLCFNYYWSLLSNPFLFGKYLTVSSFLDTFPSLSLLHVFFILCFSGYFVTILFDAFLVSTLQAHLHSPCSSFRVTSTFSSFSSPALYHIISSYVLLPVFFFPTFTFSFLFLSLLEPVMVRFLLILFFSVSISSFLLVIGFVIY